MVLYVITQDDLLNLDALNSIGDLNARDDVQGSYAFDSSTIDLVPGVGSGASRRQHRSGCKSLSRAITLRRKVR